MRDVLSGAFASAFANANARQRRRPLDTCTGLDSLAAIGWRNSKRLVREAFRQGYSVRQTGLGGTDSGIDPILLRDGQFTLAQ